VVDVATVAREVVDAEPLVGSTEDSLKLILRSSEGSKPASKRRITSCPSVMIEKVVMIVEAGAASGTLTDKGVSVGEDMAAVYEWEWT